MALLSSLQPDGLAADVASIDYAHWYGLGVRHLVFDIDNTLVIAEADRLPQDRLQLLRTLVWVDAFQTLTLATNSRRPLAPMAASISASLHQPSGLRRKPLRWYFQRILEDLGCNPSEILMIDDKLIHVMGAKYVGMRTLLVESLGEEKLIDTLLCRRKIEMALLRRWGIRMQA